MTPSRRARADAEPVDPMSVVGSVIASVKPSMHDAVRVRAKPTARARASESDECAGSWLIPAADAAALALERGTVITAPLAKSLHDADRAFAAWTDTLRAVTGRPGAVSRAALIRRLLKRGHDPARARAAAARAAELRLVDDEALARSLAGAAARSARLGPAAIVAKLLRRGIDSDLARCVVREATADTDQNAAAAALALRRASRAGLDLSNPSHARRLYAFLARRGFDGQACSRALTSARAAPR